MCEVCCEKNVNILDWHHIIPRTDPESTNDWDNLAVLCSNCHRSVHDGIIKIIGVCPSTSPTKRFLIFEKNGVRNSDIDPPKYHKKPRGTKYESV